MSGKVNIHHYLPPLRWNILLTICSNVVKKRRKCDEKNMFSSPIQNLTAKAKVEGFCFKSPEFLAAFLQVPLEKELLLLLCLLYCLAPGRSNRKLNTYQLSLQLNSCLWYAIGHVTEMKKKSFTIITIKLLSPICKKQGMSQKLKKNCLHVNKNWVIE